LTDNNKHCILKKEEPFVDFITIIKPLCDCYTVCSLTWFFLLCLLCNYTW